MIRLVTQLNRVGALLMCVQLLTGNVIASNRNKQELSLKEYISRVQAEAVQSPAPATSGSLWRDSGTLANISADYRARSTGDLIVINIVEQTLAQASGSVASQRTFGTQSGVTGVVGRIKTGGVDPLVSASSDTQLKGQAQAASSSSLKTSVTGQVVATLPNGNLVIEARRNLLVNNERQTVTLRGVARPGDINASNVVLSSQLANLEVEVRGKGVISEGTRQPNWVVRTLLRFLTF